MRSTSMDSQPIHRVSVPAISMEKLLPSLFIGALSLFGLATVLLGVAYLQMPYVTGSLAAIGTLILISGLLDIAIAILLIPFISSMPRSIGELTRIPRIAIVMAVIILKVFLGGIAYTIGGAHLVGVCSIIGSVAMGIAFALWYTRYRSAGIELPVIIGFAIALSGIFLAIAGFAGHLIVLASHLGVLSIALILFGFTVLAYAMRTVSLSVKTLSVLELFTVLIFAVAIIVGGALGIWASMNYFRARIGIAIAIAVLDLLGGIAAISMGGLTAIALIGRMSRAMTSARSP